MDLQLFRMKYQMMKMYTLLFMSGQSKNLPHDILGMTQCRSTKMNIFFTVQKLEATSGWQANIPPTTKGAPCFCCRSNQKKQPPLTDVAAAHLKWWAPPHLKWCSTRPPAHLIIFDLIDVHINTRDSSGHNLVMLIALVWFRLTQSECIWLVSFCALIAWEEQNMCMCMFNSFFIKGEGAHKIKQAVYSSRRGGPRSLLSEFQQSVYFQISDVSVRRLRFPGTDRSIQQTKGLPATIHDCANK